MSREEIIKTIKDAASIFASIEHYTKTAKLLNKDREKIIDDLAVVLLPEIQKIKEILEKYSQSITKRETELTNLVQALLTGNF
jgi:CO dehydrogenase/acetyl-CoA synthase beta subunit